MKKNIVSLWNLIGPHRRREILFLLVLMFLASLAEIVSIGAVLPFLTVLTNPDYVYQSEILKPIIILLGIQSTNGLLLALTLLFVFIAIGTGIFRVYLLFKQTTISHSIGSELSIGIYRRILYQPYTYHLENNSGDLIATVALKADQVVHLIVIPALNIINSLLLIIFIVTVLFTINAEMAFAAFLGFSVTYLSISQFTRNRLRLHSKTVALEQSRVMRSLHEGLGGIRDVLIDGSQETYCRVFSDADFPLRYSRAKVEFIAASPRYVVESLAIALIATLAYGLSVSESNNFIASLPALGALALGAQRLMPALQQCYANLSLLRSGDSQLSEALALLELPVIADHFQVPSHPLPFSKSIELNHVAVRFPSRTTAVLQDINLVVQRGTRVGIIGTTGSGKSTLLDVIMGLVPPTEGCLKIDGVEICHNNRKAWQTHISHVPQTIFLSDSSIAQNIALSKSSKDIDMELVKRVAEAAQLSKAIESFELKYDTAVGERGIRLSGGQRQRIGIARALYKQTDVIVLDEATSALDIHTEDAVMEAIRQLNGDVTLFIVAHRLSTLRNCDIIIEIADGLVSRVGSFSALVK